ncbi:cell division protein ZapA [Clostridium sp. DJ247]|uniref:cell division protein ZapA n=1 Tax=Clostridium sp. DJ247 TaxID=2726188 RepID=UPI00162359E1|nr:cell division protein ZapA [Clostridium sp. DJ247]MBC2580279.1 cell division protein ZapA [Clostridium sp. DJ247]
MNRVTVKINGIEYNLKGEEHEEYLHKVAGYVDKKVKNILDNNTMLSTSSAAILSAVNIVDDMFKKQIQFEETLKKVEQLEKRQAIYEEQIESLKNQLKHMEAYNSELQEKLKNNINIQELQKKEEETKNLLNQMVAMKDEAERYMRENSELKSINKEMKFQLQSAKYKAMDLQNKLMENQINLAKERKQNNPFLREKK